MPLPLLQSLECSRVGGVGKHQAGVLEGEPATVCPHFNLSSLSEHGKRRSAKNARNPSSTRSSRGATPRRRSSSTTRRSPTASATLATNALASRFIDDGRLPIHNNLSELALRSEAIGRKNWLFAGGDEGGEVNASCRSLRAAAYPRSSRSRTCETFSACCPRGRITASSSSHPSSAGARNDVRRRLDENPFRKATLETGRAEPAPTA